MSASAPPIIIWDVITDFLATNPTPQEIIDFRLPEELEARAHYLLERNTEDKITADEREEMVEFMRADDVMSLLKVKTKRRLRDSDS